MPEEQRVPVPRILWWVPLIAFVCATALMLPVFINAWDLVSIGWQRACPEVDRTPVVLASLPFVITFLVLQCAVLWQ